MGNHEFNAISYAVEDPDRAGDYVRSHEGQKGEKHFRQHKEFLAEVPFGSLKRREVLDWFRTLPLWLDLGEVRVVHACWHQPSLGVLEEMRGGSPTITDSFLVDANRKGSTTHRLIETVLKGPELSLTEYDCPPFRDKGGDLRHEARIRWWDSDAVTLRAVAEIQPDALGEDGEPYPLLPEAECTEGEEYRYHQDQKRVFFGHYWRTGAPTIAGPRTVCVDYSAVRAGESLVAYRFDGGERLSDDSFVSFTC